MLGHFTAGRLVFILSAERNAIKSGGVDKKRDNSIPYKFPANLFFTASVCRFLYFGLLNHIFIEYINLIQLSASAPLTILMR